MSNTFHVALYVKDIDAAVAEYRKILGIAPAKVRPGYAKFELADPPVILSLNVGGDPGTLSHLGVRYPGTGEVASELVRAKSQDLDMIQQEPIKQHLVGILQRTQVDVAFEVVIFSLICLVGADDLFVQRLDKRRQKAEQAQASPLLGSERRTFVEHRLGNQFFAMQSGFASRF